MAEATEARVAAQSATAGSPPCGREPPAVPQGARLRRFRERTDVQPGRAPGAGTASGGGVVGRRRHLGPFGGFALQLIDVVADHLQRVAAQRQAQRRCRRGTGRPQRAPGAPGRRAAGG